MEHPIQGHNSLQIILKLQRVRKLCKEKFKKNAHAVVIQAENNLLKAQEEVHGHLTNVHCINIECKMADLIKKAKEERDSALQQMAKIARLIIGDENTKFFH